MIDVFKREIAEVLGHLLNKPSSEIIKSLEKPKILDHGHLAFPVFALAKEKRQAPPAIAIDLAKQLTGKILNVSQISALSGFLNFKISPEAMQAEVFREMKAPDRLGCTDEGKGQRVVIDFSSPNIAKPMHVGHLRPTVIGQAIKNLAQSQGYDVIAVNHIGDWGSQFGKLAWAMQNWGSGYDFSVDPIKKLVELYVRFHAEAAKNPDLEKKGAETFLKLEQGDPEIQKLWKKVIEYSFKDYERLYALLGTKHDVILGESFYNDKLQDVVNRLEKKSLLKESEGAQVVFFEEAESMPPCIIKKSDGASIYATRDLAAAIYRKEVQKADQLIYVVGHDQSLHFKQVFKVLQMLGYDWAESCHHISFGFYQFKDGKMSTREGRVILLEDVISKSIEMVTQMISQKNPDLENKDQVAKEVGVGALIFHDLLNDRLKNVEFDWERVLSLDGDSGPYVQYTNVRCQSLIRKYGSPVSLDDLKLMDSLEEQRLMFTILQFQDVVSASYKNFKPNILAQYMLELSGNFSSFYNKCRILGEDPAVEKSRMALVKATELTLIRGMQLMNMPIPKAM
ncbi:MAG: arginine--tRNA ligase [Bdellovibrionota bacterium]